MEEIVGETDARVGTRMTRRQEWVIIIIISRILGGKRREKRHEPMPCVLPTNPPLPPFTGDSGHIPLISQTRRVEACSMSVFMSRTVRPCWSVLLYMY